MKKIKPINQLKTTLFFLGLFIVGLGPILFTNSVSAAVEPGCYAKLAGSQENILAYACPTEEYRRAVDQQDECYVFAASNIGVSSTGQKTNCNDITLGLQTNQNSQPGGQQRTDCETNDSEELTTENCKIIEYLVTGINFLSALAGMAIIASIMIAGYQYMTAGDNSGQIQKAKSRIQWALIALLLFIFMYALLNFLVPGGVL